MAKNKKTVKKKKKSDAKRNQKVEFFKTLLGMTVLVAVVFLAGFIAHNLIPKNLTAAHIPEKKIYNRPLYEICPQEKPKAVYKTITKRVSKPKNITADGLPRVALIVDDIGYDRMIAEKFLELDVPVTFSVLPFSPFQKGIVEKANKKGIEIMLHLPMEPVEYPMVAVGPGGLLTSMGPDELVDQLNKDIDSVLYVKGVNNHMGSKMTADSDRMNQIFSILKKRGLFFIDSRTTHYTLCKSSARLFHVPFSSRDVFIDHEHNKGFISKQIKELVRIAEQKHEAVGICHPFPETLEVLAETIPVIKKKVIFVSASSVVRNIN